MKKTKKTSITKRVNRERFNFYLDKLDLVLTAAYALITQEWWADILKDQLTSSGLESLIMASVALVAIWVAIGELKKER